MLRLGKVVVGLGIASAVAFANPTSDLSSGLNISKSDSEFLFQDGAVNAVALSSDEMKATEGEWLPLFWTLGFGWAASTAYAPTTYSAIRRPYLWSYYR